MPPIKGRSAKAQSISAKGHRLNSIGVGEHDVSTLLDKLDERSSNAKTAVKRTHTRLPFRQVSLTMTLEHPGGSRSNVQVVCRNMSRGGVGVLHSGFVHTGTRCTVKMPRTDEKTDCVEGAVVRCSHLGGHVHELGISFDEPIVIERYLKLAPSDGRSTFEKVDPKDLKGTVVALVGSEIDGRMLKHFLSDSPLKIKITSDAEEGVRLMSEACDVAMIDIAVPCAEEMALAVRRGNKAVPLIAISQDDSRATRAAIDSLGIAGFLIKPLTNKRVLGMLADCLLCESAVPMPESAEGELSPALVSACVEQLKAITNTLRDAAAGSDAMQCYALCQQLKATCSPIGLQEIDSAAERASKSLSESMSVAESQTVVQDLIRLCERVRTAA